MGVTDLVNYVIFTNPISSGTMSMVTYTTKAIGNYMGVAQAEVKMPPVPLWKLANSAGPFVRIAGFSGAAAVALGAYGSHKLIAEKEPENVRIFETANRYHFIHTLALLGLPLCRKPSLAAIFFTCGIIVFCGSCYYFAFTNDRRFSKVTPFGGTCFILGWLSLLI